MDKAAYRDRFFFFFEVLIEFVITLHLFYVLVFWPRPQGMWDLNSVIKD